MAIALWGFHPRLWLSYIDYRAVLSVFGFLIVVKALEDSGLLRRISYAMSEGAGSERGFAVLVVLGTVVLAALVTNDLALFAFIPVVLAAPIDDESKFRILVLIALASNVGAFVSPVGNPQKIVLWQMSGESFLAFLRPFIFPFLALLLMIITYTFLLVPSAQIRVSRARPRVHRRAALKDGLAFLVYFLLLAFGQWGIAVLFAIIYYTLVYPRVFLRIDWLFLLLLVVLFVDFGILSAHFRVSALIPPALLDSPRGSFIASFILTQILSDVPTAVLLSHYTRNYVAVAMGTTVGAMGLVVASVANILAVRFSKKRHRYLLFHRYSIPFALAAFLVVLAFLS